MAIYDYDQILIYYVTSYEIHYYYDNPHVYSIVLCKSIITLHY
jgi:hypothetical protein